MLKQILIYIATRTSPSNNFKEFTINIISNFISNRDIEIIHKGNNV